MKLFRAPHSSDRWTSQPDSCDTDWLEERWEQGTKVSFDATVKKEGSRHTAIGIELEPDDIVSAMNGMIRYYRKECEERQSECGSLRKALERIRKLTFHTNLGPSNDAIIEAIRVVASYHCFHPSPEDGQPEIEWESKLL